MARKLHWTSVAALAAAALAIGLMDATSVQAAGHWQTDYQQARSQAQREGKLLLLHFHASWCGPCRRMDQEVLSTQALKQRLGKNIIAVKIDSDRYRQLTAQLNVQSLPSDIFMTAEGKVLHRTSGYQPAGNYLQMVSSVSSKYVGSRPVVVARQPKPAPSKSKQLPVTEKPAQKKLVAPRSKPREDVIARVDQKLSHEILDVTAADETDDSIGLRGFCPVTLWNSREWKPGRPEYSMTFKGLTYHMYSAQALAEFEQNPRQFAPRLMGCDPVVMSAKNLANPGSTSFGAFYDGELYLFESDESRRQFKLDPERYSKIRQVKLPKPQSQLR
ncbi:Thioredoxin-like protein [Symmachiella dynata]|uniref:Thioredoxin-like protein n=1 Tax=Symmachiella dynata TaxID=2527995 RepID=A0A517ZM77_9PLAN|nr:thioredoxin family protein [Symmachiella dynata]QDU43525.1 Thioredoxin-like protein [Symmachiella dynata]